MSACFCSRIGPPTLLAHHLSIPGRAQIPSRLCIPWTTKSHAKVGSSTIARALHEGIEAALSPPASTVSYPDDLPVTAVAGDVADDMVVNGVADSREDEEPPAPSGREKKKSGDEVDDSDSRFKLRNGKEFRCSCYVLVDEYEFRSEFFLPSKWNLAS
ncbi:hypothetical protein Dimus_002691 [Dionaea muscipula]